jgi:hypothetical protein
LFYGILREMNMNVRLGLFAVVMALAALSISADAQAPPPGSYQRTCREIRMQGPNLIAVCIREHGRGEQLTALNVAHCRGDIRNLNGQLQCTGGQPVPPPGQEAAPLYPGPGYPPPAGYAPPGYPSPPPRYGEDREYWERCERWGHDEREIFERLQYTPPGEQRERLEHRLHELREAREWCPHR